jgi:two-component system OmpR family response regulator
METSIARDGVEGLEAARSEDFDAIVLDLMLPRLDGLAVCRTLREEGDWTPVLMLTARGGVKDRVRGLKYGADDYLAKPFSLAELSARVQAISRRRETAAPAMIEVGDLLLDSAERRATRRGQSLKLSPTEFDLLELLMRHPGHLLSREQILAEVWGEDGPASFNVLQVYVGYLRDKIDRPFGTDSIETIRGTGYRLKRSG